MLSVQVPRVESSNSVVSVGVAVVVVMPTQYARVVPETALTQTSAKGAILRRCNWAPGHLSADTCPLADTCPGRCPQDSIDLPRFLRFQVLARRLHLSES